MNNPKKALFVGVSTIKDTLEETPQEGKRALEGFFERIGTKDVPFSILEGNNVQNGAETHAAMGDLFVGLEGEAVFTVGGSLVNPRTKQDSEGNDIEFEQRAESIEGGEEKIVGKGDMLWIPARVPHQHRVEGVSRMMIIKIPER